MNEPIIIELSNYVKPEIVEKMNEEWVLNGSNNEFFDYVIDRYNGSPTNGAIIDAYIDRIYGKGLSIKNAKSNASEYAALRSVLSPKDVKKIVADAKAFGSAVGQVRYSKSGKRTIAKIEHLERKMVAPNKMDKDGEIPGYWVCDDWKRTITNKPKFYPRFGTSNKNIEIFEIKPYSFGKSYFADPDYVQVLQWAMLEEEIANFSVNHIKNGLSAGYIINFNNGIPEEEKQEETEKRVNAKMTGSNNAARVIISFNNNKDTAPTIEAIPQNASHEQWQFWAGEARQQIMTGHRITTPMLVGVKDNTGFGNNANEMQEGSKLLHETTIRPLQNEILDVFQQLVAVNNISSPLVFVPLEDDEEKEEKKKEVVEKANTEQVTEGSKNEEEVQLQVQLSAQADELLKCADDDMEGWECIDTVEVDYELEEKRDALLQLASTGTAIPNARSEQDSLKFKVRYQYAPLTAGANSREFCRKMVSAEKVYRKEDIIRMGSLPVNPGFGPGGSSTYSIWLYKGGPRCHHKWLRKTYVKKSSSPFGTPDVDVKSPLAQEISTAEARRRGDRTVNAPQVSMKPKDMPNEGFLTRFKKIFTNG